MTDVRDNELRWFIGKVAHCAANAESLVQFAEFTIDVAVPEGCLVDVADDPVGDPHSHAHSMYHASFEAIEQLYASSPDECAVAHWRLEAAFGRLAETMRAVPETTAELEDVSEAAEVAEIAEAAEGVGSAAPVAVIDDAGSGAASAALDQSVSAGGDINAPVVNAAGDVSINDNTDELHKQLHDYLTYLVYLSLGVKRPHATPEVAELVGEAMEALTEYHRKTDKVIGGASWGYFPELRQSAHSAWEQLDEACAKVLGQPLEKVRVGLFEAPMPSFDLFGEMRLIRGGFDPYTQRNVEPFYISRTPVTIAQYDEFCREMQYPRVPEWNEMSPPDGLLDHPVTGVALLDSVMYCLWLEAATGFRFRLPTEAEWCFTATEGRRQQYPWGDEYVTGRASTSIESPRGTAPVDVRADGATRSGVLDMVGNVWEITSTLFADDPTEPDHDVTFPPYMFALGREAWWATDRRIPRGAGPWAEAARLVMRGGSWGGGPEWAGMDQRIWTSMFNRGEYGGFRVVCSAEQVGAGFVPAPSYLSPRVAHRGGRIQLTNSDGTDAISQNDFGSCGGGGTAQGAVSQNLLDAAMDRYQGVGDTPFSQKLFASKASEAASATGFPDLRVQGTFRLPERIAAAAGDTWATSIDELISNRTGTETGRLVERARLESALLGHDRVTTGHLLYAMVLSDSEESRGLSSLGVDASAVRNLLVVVDRREGEDSPANSDYTDRAVRTLVEPTPSIGYSSGLSADVLLDRLAQAEPGVAVSILSSLGVDAVGLKARRRQLSTAERVARGAALGDDEDEAELLGVLDELPLSDSDRRVVRAGLLTRRAANAVSAGGGGAEVEGALEAAAEARAQAGDTPREGELADLWRIFDAVCADGYDGAVDPLAVADELVAGEARPRGRRSLSLMRRASIRSSRGDHAGALDDLDIAVEAGRIDARAAMFDESRSGIWRLHSALNNRAVALAALGRPAEALESITECLTVMFPSETPRRPLFPGRPVTPDPDLDQTILAYEDTLRTCCNAAGVNVDERFVAYFAYHAAVAAGAEAHEDLPALDRLELWAPASFDDPAWCGMCRREPATVAGVRGQIGESCLRIAEEVLAVRDQSEADDTEHQHPSRCSFCGLTTALDRDDVSSGRITMCRTCIGRARAFSG